MPKKLSTSDSRPRPTMPNMPAMTKRAELVADLDVEELVGGERAGEGGEGAEHGLDDDAAPNCASNNLLIAPRATPSAAAKAMTRAGLMTRLNEFASDSRNAPPAPSMDSRSSARL